jgi:glycosyltransferase involved in cell wall biosynthesis
LHNFSNSHFIKNSFHKGKPAEGNEGKGRHPQLSGKTVRWCVVVPTFNNGQFLENFLDDLQKITKDIIVINDGSTDGTTDILDRYKGIFKISFPANRGKGSALKAGFSAALSMGYDYAVTLDSDGQHDVADIHDFIGAMAESPDTLIIGSREIYQPNRRKGSSFANRFSNFWFKVITGRTLPDTQSGFRLYPLFIFRDTKFYTRRYEYELEVLVRTIWKGIPVKSIPINVKYSEREKQVSHFRPFRDFVRISLLNTVLVIVSFLYVKPFSFAKYLKKENIRQFLLRHVINTRDSYLKTSLSAGFGVFMGIIPIWGYQLITAIALAHFMRLNKFIVIVAANISIPPMIPLILYLSYVTGGWVTNTGNSLAFSHADMGFDFIKANLYRYVIGSIVFAVIAGVISGLLTFYMLRFFRKKQVLKT